MNIYQNKTFNLRELFDELGGDYIVVGNCVVLNVKDAVFIEFAPENLNKVRGGQCDGFIYRVYDDVCDNIRRGFIDINIRTGKTKRHDVFMKSYLPDSNVEYIGVYEAPVTDLINKILSLLELNV